MAKTDGNRGHKELPWAGADRTPRLPAPRPQLSPRPVGDPDGAVWSCLDPAFSEAKAVSPRDPIPVAVASMSPHPPAEGLPGHGRSAQAQLS